MSHEHEAAVDSGTDAKKLSAVGGFVGTVLGSRRGPVSAVAGGVVGGTVGYLAGATLEGDAAGTVVEDEPVSIDVADPDSTDDNGVENEAGDGDEAGDQIKDGAEGNGEKGAVDDGTGDE